ncbi:MAG: TolC family protein [Gemmatales bacterium]
MNRLLSVLASSLCCWFIATQLAAQDTPLARLPEKPSEKQATSQPAVVLKPGESPIDLGSALRLAGVQNLELIIARERVTETLAIKQWAAAQALPNINIGSNYDAHRGPLQQDNGNILNVSRDSLYVGLGANAVGGGTVNIPGVNYNLNIGTAWFNYLQSQQLVARAEAATRTTENNTLLRVCLGYTDLLQAEARLAILVQNKNDAAELARITEAFAQTGQGRKADADRAQVELRKRESEVAQGEADIISSSARLAKILNLDPVVKLVCVEGNTVPSPVVPDPVPVSELVAIALMQRPELEERRAEIVQSIYALSNAKWLPFSPNVVLGFSTGAFGGGSNLISQPPGFIGGNGVLQTGPRFGNFDDRVDFDAIIYFTFQNLGFGNLAQIKASDSRVKQAELRQLDTTNRIRAEVVEAHARTQAKLKQIDPALQALESSKQAFTQDMARIRGRQGLPIEVVDSMRLLGRSRIEYLDTIMEFNRTQFQLYVAMGQPPAAALARPVPASTLPDTSTQEKK